MRLMTALAATLLCAAPLAAQNRTPDEQAVLDVVVRLFDAMRTRDTTFMRAAMDPNARLTSSAVRQGQQVLESSTINDWIMGVARAPDSLVLIERTWNHEVRIDDGLATVWTPYAFYIGPRFSHCGVDSFQLVKSGTAWKIVAVSDTRRRDRCNEPAR